ncbi:hypothetical protein Mpsy_1100 [Methanolobus psychrophilus R15]|nr:hypothetical protein Mpsy_1100 [Methanolobus psychrophilus R15]
MSNEINSTAPACDETGRGCKGSLELIKETGLKMISQGCDWDTISNKFRGHWMLDVKAPEYDVMNFLENAWKEHTKPVSSTAPACLPTDESMVQAIGEAMVEHFIIRDAGREFVAKMISDFIDNFAKYKVSPMEKEALEKKLMEKVYNYEETKQEAQLKEEFKGFDRATIKDKALKIAQYGDPYRFILNTYNKVIIGEFITGSFVLLQFCCCAGLNTKGLHQAMSGPSGEGKSYGIKYMLFIMPSELYSMEKFSDKSLFYKKFPDGFLIYIDEVNLSQNATDIIKEATTNFQHPCKYTTVDMGIKGEDKSLTLTTAKRLAFILSSVLLDGGEQLRSRFFSNEVKPSEDRDRTIDDSWIDMQENCRSEDDITEDVLICREIMRDIRKSTYRVKFSKEVGDMFRARPDKKNKRLREMLADMVKSFAILRHHQRHRDSKGNLIATIEDYNDAMEILSPRESLIATKRTDNEEKVLQVVMKRGYVNLNDIISELGMTDNQVNKAINGKGRESDSGLRSKVPGFLSEKVQETSEGKTTSRTYYFVASNPIYKLVKAKLDEAKKVNEKQYNPGDDELINKPVPKPNIMAPMTIPKIT